MKRTGFARKVYERAPAAPLRALEQAPNYAGTTGAAIPKEPRLEIPLLREMMRRPGQGCLMQVLGVCLGARDDTCGCHGNSQEYNKGMGLKAHDSMMVRGCARCHTWLDSSYSATGEERQSAFKVGHWRQIAEWQRDVKDAGIAAKDRAAIALALAHLSQLGYLV